jgi:hypothetical protein
MHATRARGTRRGGAALNSLLVVVGLMGVVIGLYGLLAAHLESVG